MSTLFTRIIDGELPGRFVWRDELAVGFLTINPIRPGHTLVVPRLEIDHWLDLPANLLGHLSGVAQKIGQAQLHAFASERIGLMIAGMEVPHVHLHVLPIDTEADLDFARADRAPTDASLDDAARRLRDALRTAGHADVSD